MARKKRHEEPVNHERWLISYADFITLLFAFFVVMYSISSVNEGKYRVLSDALSTTFQDKSKGLDIIQIGELPVANAPISIIPVLDSEIRLADVPFDMEGEGSKNLEGGEGDANLELKAEELDADDTAAAAEALSALSEEIEEVMSPFIQDKLINIKKSKFWLEIEMKSRLLFASGNARLSRKALVPLTEIAKTIAPLKNPIFVEGYTDNIPIRTLTYPSNWELSAARAASVVNLFGKLGIRPNRMAAIGYGEHRPIADNKTQIGRDTNRRVSIIVMADSRQQGPLTFYQKKSALGSKVSP